MRRKILATTTALILAITATLLLTPAPSGYETSIYSAYPPTFWILLSLVPVLAIVYTASYANEPGWRWAHALPLLYITYLLLFAIPEFRGYFLYGRAGADILAHLGYVKTALTTGHLPADNHYPIQHVLMAVLAKFGLPVRTLPLFVSFFFYVLHTVGVFLYTREITSARRAAILAIAVSIPLIYLERHRTAQPLILSFMFLPIVLFVFERTRTSLRRRNTLLLFILSVLIIFFHPETALILFLIISFSILAREVFNRTQNRHSPQYSRLGIAIIGILMFIWYINFPFGQNHVRKLASYFFLETQITTEGKELTGQAREFGEIVQLLWQTIVTFGSIGIYLTLAGVMALIIAWKLYTYVDVDYAKVLGLTMYMSSILTGLILLFYIPLFGESVTRNVRFSLLVSVFVIAMLLHYSQESTVFEGPFDLKIRSHSLLTILIIGLILASVPLATVNVYEPNTHYTESEFRGTEFFLERYDDDHHTRSLHISFKVEIFMQEPPSRLGQSPFRRYRTDQTTLPEHLGYDRNEYAATTFRSQTYLITKDYDVEFYKTRKEALQDEVKVYDTADRERLEMDHTVHKLYENGGFEVWSVK